MLVSIRKHFGKFIPPALRSFFLRHLSFLDRRTKWWIGKDPYRNDPPHSMYESPYPVKLGIFKEFWHRHVPYVAACREMKVAYEIIDIAGEDWLDNVKNSNCDAFLVMPSVQLSQWKTLFDERLRILIQDLGITVFPGYNELWLYESKRRMAYWLEANGIPHAKTHVFYRRDDAFAFSGHCTFPVVAKTNLGARASGVKIIRKASELRAYIKKAFGKGIVHGDGDPHDPDWGYVIIQDFIPCKYEWRIINIGPYYMGHRKLKKGEFCSGSGLVGWAQPSNQVLQLVCDVLEKGHFQTADVDVFEAEDGRLYVNEIQALFGSILPYQMLCDGTPGYFTKGLDGGWIFHEGVVCQNASCNLRVASLMTYLGCPVELPSLSLDEVLEEDKRASQALVHA